MYKSFGTSGYSEKTEELISQGISSKEEKDALHKLNDQSSKLFNKKIPQAFTVVRKQNNVLEILKTDFW
ncbi:hypothetical protein GF322_05340 [Candidatus Dependentiae bacterium]|nr:hypothetical protein [Candidatus Dependentiae bacterium]